MFPKETIKQQYRPPSGNQQEFLNMIISTIAEISTARYSNIYHVGDLNLDHTTNTGNKSETTITLENYLKWHGMTQYISNTTRKTSTTSTILDVMYIKREMKLAPFSIHTSLSDHYLVGCVRYVNYNQPDKITFTGRTYKNYSLEAAQEFYSRRSRSQIYKYNDAEIVWNHLFRIIKGCANTLCPYKTSQIRSDKPVSMTTEILEEMGDRDRAFLEAYETNSPAKLTEAKNLRCSTKKAIRNARADYVQQQLKKNSHNPRKMWQNINALIKTNPKKSQIKLTDKLGMYALKIRLFPIISIPISPQLAQI